MFENIDIEKLRRAKEKLEDLKALKFSLRASKHKNDPYTFPILLVHYREELADISNMIDLMFEYLERFEGR